MRRLLLLLVVLVAGSYLLYGQSRVTIDNFDSRTPDSVSVHWMSKEAQTVFTMKYDSTDKVQGTGSVKVWAKLDSVHQWGTYAQFGYTLPDTATPWDWSASDSISLWVKVRQAPTIPANMVFRLSFKDKPNTDPAEEYIYENTFTLSSVNSGWVNLKVPFFERTQNAGGTLVPDSTGFVLAPTSWGGFTYNNKTLDRNKIVGYSLAIVTTGWNPTNNIPQDSILVSFDNFERFGVRSFPVVFFSGKDWPTYYTTWTWGQSSISVAPNAGTVPGENAVMWTQGDEWANGWSGWGGDLSSPFNMAGAWAKDSLKMMIKADSCGPLRAQFEDGTGKRGTVFQPTQDGQWHLYALPLRAMTGQDGTTTFDSSAVTKFGVMAEASAKAGRVIYLTQIWTGSPTLDVVAPPPPGGLLAVGASFSNLLTWNAVPNEPGVRYDVYFADHPWTSLADTTVEDIPLYGLTSTLANHVLRAPVTDQNVSYYYGVTAKDLAGNLSAPAVMSTPSTATMAKGVPTIALAPPASFVANGNVGEWTAASIAPFNLSVVSGTAHGVPNYLVTNDADLSVKAYLATDANNLYVAFDVTDDHVVADTAASATDYQQDAPDLFIGLYDWRGKHHDGYTGGSKPDYHFRFSKHRIWLDNGGVEVMHRGDPNYAWVEKTLTSGYVVEAKIPFALLATKLTGRNDVVFVPKNGKRIPIDFAINDRDDAVTAVRHAIMCYSTISNDNSWQAQYYWTNTWLGTQWVTGVKQMDEIAQTYRLEQNYPNPFNPSTQIKYSIAQGGMVSLKVFDVLGREVATLVNGPQAAGTYAATFSSGDNGRSLASGVYFYRLEAGAFVSVHKMVLLK